MYRGNLVSFSLIVAVTLAPGIFWERLFGATTQYPFLVGLAKLALAFFAQAVVVYGAVEYMAGRRPRPGAVLARGFAVSLPVIGVSFMLLIAFMFTSFAVGLFALFLPFLLGFPLAIYLMLRLASTLWVVIPAAVVERDGMFSALRRSADLTRGNRLAIAGAVFAMFLFFWLTLWGAGYAVRAFIDVSDMAALVRYRWVMNGVLFLVMVVFTALICTSTAVVYSHLRETREGVGADELAEIFS